ncbi:MAG TPA: response regulator [Opitutaceae bacterium]|nr:response regulator [Opitutaceae bacterium]
MDFASAFAGEHDHASVRNAGPLAEPHASGAPQENGVGQLLRVLFVEDNPQDCETILRHLVRAGYTPECVRVDGEAEFREKLNSEPDVILCAYQLAQFGSMAALRILHETGRPIPLIVVSNGAGEETAVNAIRSGAADYLRKDRLIRIAQSIEHAIEQCRLRHEHRRMMEALLKAEARYRGIFENAVEGIFQATPEGRLTAANPALSRVLGYASPAEAIAAVDNILVQLCQDPARLQELRCGLETTGLVTGFETQASCPDGRQPWVSLNCRWVRDPSNGPSHLEGTVEDITERKKLETHLLRAQRLDSIGRLAGGIAHDLNNILLPILICPGLLRERVRDEVSRDLVDSIEVSARRGADIVRQLLTFSRGTDGERVPVQPRTLVNEMLSIMRETFPKSINLRSAIPTDVWSVRGDQTQLHQVLMNLCVNARDAMPHGGDLRLMVENCEVDDATARANAGARAGRHVLLRVSDSGTGIPPEHLDKIFDPFFTTKEVGQGTGLGLSTVLGIVNSHGGFIQLESSVGQGTEFRIYLPACAQLDCGEMQAVAEGPRGHGEVILLVDDERAVRQATRMMLERHGYRVVEARDGDDALERLEQHGTQIAAAVVDLLMPRMDGVELIRQMRRRASAPPIVAMTGVGKSPKVSQVKRFGGVQILEKPFTAEALLQALERVLRQDAGVAGSWGW